jgi:hypothetical protein
VFLELTWLAVTALIICDDLLKGIVEESRVFYLNRLSQHLLEGAEANTGPSVLISYLTYFPASKLA